MSELLKRTPSVDNSASGHSAPGTGDLRVWVNGALVDPGSPHVSPTDHGLVVGNGVFEALKVDAAGTFSIQRHLDRLTRSARSMGLPDPDHDQIRGAIDAVLADRTYELGKIRITYTGGHGPLGSHAAYGPPTVVVAADSRPRSPEIAAIVTTPWTRNESGAMAGVKSTSYGENVLGLAYAYQRDATEGIFANTAGNLCEGTGSNIFCIFGDTIVTPPLSAGPLAGITRALLLEWCEITERDLTPAEAKGADEVFVTSSLRDIQSVRRWDDTEFTAIGPVTQRVIDTFSTRSGDDLDP